VRAGVWGGFGGTSSPRARRVGVGRVRRKDFLLLCGASGGRVGSNFPCGTSGADMLGRAGLPKAPASGHTHVPDVLALA